MIRIVKEVKRNVERFQSCSHEAFVRWVLQLAREIMGCYSVSWLKIAGCVSLIGHMIYYLNFHIKSASWRLAWYMFTGIFHHIDTLTSWLLFCRQDFRLRFLQWKSLYLDSNFAIGHYWSRWYIYVSCWCIFSHHSKYVFTEAWHLLHVQNYVWMLVKNGKLSYMWQPTHTISHVMVGNRPLDLFWLCHVLDIIFFC